MQHECVIVGGGPAGSALAIALARVGREVILIERTAGPHHKVCGEFLSYEALRYLAALGVEASRLGAVPVSAFRMIRGPRVFETPLPFAALSLSRWRLDEALLQQACAAGAQVIRGQAAEHIAGAPGAWEIALASAEKVRARTVFLASGKHDVRGWKRPPGRQPNLVAFKMHWHLESLNTRALQGCVELMLVPGGYCGLELVEDDTANLCLVVSKEYLGNRGHRWPALLQALQDDSPHLCLRLAGATPLWPRPLSIAAIPYGYLQEKRPGPWRIGDQFAVIPSFCGDGMALALHSASSAAAGYLQGEGPEEFRRKLSRQVRGQIDLATVISRALVSPRGQRLVCGALRLWPKALLHVAQATRIRQRALRGPENSAGTPALR